jgi:large subunit ribosomal protein L13
MMKTYSPKPTELSHEWYIIDASGQTLGRLASQIATLLMGKHKPQFSAVTGAKLTDKKYYRHSGYPGGIYETSLEDMLVKNPNKVIETAVGGMLPKNRLHDDRMKRFKVYPTAEHPHMPQQPVVFEQKGTK